MIGPKRLLEGDGTELERILLASGRAARPSSLAKWRTLVLFVLMGIGAMSRARAAAVLGAKARAWMVAQWLALGVGTAAVGWVAVQARVHSPRPPVSEIASTPGMPAASRSRVDPPWLEPSPSSLAVAESETPSPDTPVAPSNPEREPQVSVRPKRGAAVVSAPGVVERSTVGRSIASEIQELDRAREALASGEPRRAIERLDRYDRLFPKGALQQEGLRLRIEAVAANGERAAARSLARRFEALYPDSTQSERLKSLVKDP
jgi:hypothetical protein